MAQRQPNLPEGDGRARADVLAAADQPPGPGLGAGPQGRPPPPAPGAAAPGVAPAGVGDPATRLIEGLARLLNETQVLPVRKPKLKNYHGESAYPLMEFLEDFEAYVGALNIPQAARAAFLIDHLRGEPLREIRACAPEVRNDVAQIRTRLENQFRRLTPVELYSGFTRLRQKPTESLMAYARRLAPEYDAIMAACDTPAERELYGAQRERALKEQLSNGAASVDVQREIKRFGLTNPALTFNALRDQILQVFGEDERQQDEAKDVEADAVRIRMGQAGGKAKRSEDRVEQRLDKVEQQVTSLAKSVDQQVAAQGQLAATVKVMADSSVRRPRELLRMLEEVKSPPNSPRNSVGSAPQFQQQQQQRRQQQGAGFAPPRQQYPGPRPQGLMPGTNPARNRNCYRCGEPGHYAANCRSERPLPPRPQPVPRPPQRQEPPRQPSSQQPANLN